MLLSENRTSNLTEMHRDLKSNCDAELDAALEQLANDLILLSFGLRELSAKAWADYRALRAEMPR